ncbi:MAG: hypothetical protein AVO39_10185 [delta proteobacterium MLS_D]|nr:MAG: hypothetical protein AVO39_10185 [delta proteobacterium MLS_D]
MKTSFDEKNEILHLFLEGLKNQNRLIHEYKDRPIEFLAKTGSYYPPILREMFMDIYRQRVLRAMVIGPRGGGKTYSLGDIAASLFLFYGFDVLIASGGEGQAKEVYEEVTSVLGEEEVDEYVPTLTTQISKGRSGNWIRFIPASTRRGRGPHPGRGHGGLIILDEEGEMEEKIVNAVLGTGSTANPLIIIRASTAHKIDGTFADLLEEYEKKGYRLYRWDAFDVAKKCPYDCANCIEEFREEYCRGKAKKNSELGWISIDYLKQMWIEQTKEWFEVELMARRPSKAGRVIDTNDIRLAAVKECPYVKGVDGAFGIDWGFKGYTKIVATQMVEEKLRVFDANSFSETGIDDIAAFLKDWRNMYGGINEVYADSSHPFENDKLRKEGFNVTEVTFVSFKEAGAGAVKWFFEKQKIEIAEKFKELLDQLKKWRRDKSGKIVKKDDHYPDALLCTMMKWWNKARRKVGYFKVTR